MHHPNSNKFNVKVSTRSNKKTRGAALLTALFIVTVVAGIAVLMAIRQQINIHVLELMMNNDRVYFYAQGVEDWAIGQLLESATRTPGNNVVPDVFPPLKPIKFAGAVVSGVIQDQQALFNINSLADANNMAPFVRLLMTVDANLATQQAQATAIALAVNLWLTPSGVDEIYAKFLPPYRAAHHAMASISELRLIVGVTDKLYLELSPYIAALPTTKNEINVSTAPAPILMTIASMTADQAQSFLQCRQNTHGFVSTDTFNTCLSGVKATLNSNQQITVQSSYFLSVGQVNMGKQQLILTSLLYRFIQPQNKQVSVMVLWQSRDYNVIMASTD
ncbi:MAG: type II secretion system minor pseudopilin GspK [Gammaproteobacteria bacterium]